jgi:excinuclease ABC subunit B
MYADTVTGSMREAIAETERRRVVQEAYNKEHGITPESVRRGMKDLLDSVPERDYYTVEVPKEAEPVWESPAALRAHVAELEGAMKEAARRLDFERAAELRDRIKALRKAELGLR